MAFDPIWASDENALIDVPTDAEQRTGFVCGPVTPGRFNWLFQMIQSAINSLNISDMASKFRTIATTEGITGGGNLEADRTLRLDFAGLQPLDDLAPDDLIAVYDASIAAHRFVTWSDATSGLGGGGGGEGGITAGGNIGNGEGQSYSGVSGTELRFRTIKQGDGVQIATTGDEIVVSLANMGSQLTFS